MNKLNINDELSYLQDDTLESILLIDNANKLKESKKNEKRQLEKINFYLTLSMAFIFILVISLPFLIKSNSKLSFEDNKNINENIPIENNNIMNGLTPMQSIAKTEFENYIGISIPEINLNALDYQINENIKQGTILYENDNALEIADSYDNLELSNYDIEFSETFNVNGISINAGTYDNFKYYIFDYQNLFFSFKLNDINIIYEFLEKITEN